MFEKVALAMPSQLRTWKQLRHWGLLCCCWLLLFVFVDIVITVLVGVTVCCCCFCCSLLFFYVVSCSRFISCALCYTQNVTVCFAHSLCVSWVLGSWDWIRFTLITYLLRDCIHTARTIVIQRSSEGFQPRGTVDAHLTHIYYLCPEVDIQRTVSEIDNNTNNNSNK